MANPSSANTYKYIYTVIIVYDIYKANSFQTLFDFIPRINEWCFYIHNYPSYPFKKNAFQNLKQEFSSKYIFILNTCMHILLIKILFLLLIIKK